MSAESDHSTTKSGQASSGGISDTIQALIVAFVIAMTARGFVLEGFVIPTGSMAPTLMGQHGRYHSPQTGWSYAFDWGNSNRGFGSMWMNSAKILVDASRQAQAISDPTDRRRVLRQAIRKAAINRWDPYFGLDRPVERWEPDPSKAPRSRSGDRVLVLKAVYPLMEPDRFDVVVFKNPTDPMGPTQNYIKRLVGLPEEKLVTVDGDIFTGPLDRGVEQMNVARKPESVQRAVWQPVYDSSYQPIDLEAWRDSERVSWWGGPWLPDSNGELDWSIGTDRTWRCTSSGSSRLLFNGDAWPITDFNMYNIYRGHSSGSSMTPPLMSEPYAVSDVRVRGTIDAVEPGGFDSTTLEMTTRGLLHEWQVTRDEVRLRLVDATTGAEIASDAVTFSPPARAFEVDFWHVDQQMWLFIDGKLMLQLPYDGWDPIERFQASFPGTSVEAYMRSPEIPRPEPPALAWRFESTPFALRSVQVARDIYYRPVELDERNVGTARNPGNQFFENGPPIYGLGFGTNLLEPSRIEADQFVMFGDNSAASRDGRMWGRPHQLAVDYSGDSAPFVVPRKLLIGKAFSVYFPAPLPSRLPWPLSSVKINIVPDFGRIRFIR